MSKLRLSITMSVDGYVSGPDQSEENPLGVGGMELHNGFSRSRRSARCMASGRRGQRQLCRGRGAPGQHRRDDHGPQHVRAGSRPVADESWRGWWGEDPPYHHPVFVLTHHPREPLEMDGGTTFHFVRAASSPRSGRPRTPRADGTSGSRAAHRWSTSTLPPVWWTRSTSRSRRWSSSPGARLFEGLERGALKLEQVRAVDAPGVTHIKYEVG